MKFKIIESAEESFTDRQERISWWNQTKVSRAKILVVGAGAIGNETIKNLCLLGVGNIFVVDFDTIERSNLSRTVLFRTEDLGENKAEVAAKRAKAMAIHEGFRVGYYHGNLVTELGQDFFAQFDLVLGCLDNVECRIKINKCCYELGIPWIDAGINELTVRCDVFDGVNAPCYECNLSGQQRKNARLRMSCHVGKKRAVAEGKVPTTQVSSALAGAIQCQEAMKGLCRGKWLHSKRIWLDGTHDEYGLYNMRANAKCVAHEKAIFTKLDLDERVTVRELFDTVEKHGVSAKAFLLGKTVSFVSKRISLQSGKSLDVGKPNHSIFEDEILAAQVEAGILPDEPVNTEYLEVICENDVQWLDVEISEFGVPTGALVNFEDDEGACHQFCLACRDGLAIFKRN